MGGTNKTNAAIMINYNNDNIYGWTTIFTSNDSNDIIIGKSLVVHPICNNNNDNHNNDDDDANNNDDIYVYTSMCVRVCVYIYIYTHTYIHIDRHTHRYTQFVYCYLSNIVSCSAATYTILHGRLR